MESPLIARRAVIAGVAGVGLEMALGACGGSDEGTTESTGGPTSTGAGPGTPTTPVLTGPASTTAASSGPAGGASNQASSGLPNFVEYKGVKPDLAPAIPGASAGYLKYPEDPAAGVSTPPGAGGTVTALIALGGKPQLPMNKNKYWQELNKRLGVTLNVSSIPPGDFKAKVQTTIAGGDLPDILELNPTIANNLPDLLTAKFQDLTDYVAGPAIEKYPYLANFATIAWKNVLYGNRIYGVPSVSRLLGGFLSYRADLAKQNGWDVDIKSADDFEKLCHTVTNVKTNNYSIVAKELFPLLPMMFGAPNGWEVKDGKFTADLETDQYRQAIAFGAKLWSAGVLYPDSFTSNQNIVDWFGTGKIVLYRGGGIGYRGILTKYYTINPKFELGFINTPKADGGGLAPVYLTKGMNSFVAIKKGSADRVEEILRILNYVAAPFGTAEYLYMNYGIKGADYTWDAANGIPVLTPEGQDEVMDNLVYLARPPTPLFNPHFPDVTKADWKSESETIVNNLPVPTAGLYSPTEGTKGASIAKTMTDLQWDILQGHKKLSDWDTALKSWRSNGGDQIRKEYEQAYAEANG